MSSFEIDTKPKLWQLIASWVAFLFFIAGWLAFGYVAWRLVK